MISYKNKFTLLFRCKQDCFKRILIAIYKSVMDGVRSYHNTVMKGVEIVVLVVLLLLQKN